MIQLSDITIDNKELFDKYFSMKQYEISDFTFTNLFMWRNSYNIKYAIINDFLCIFAQYKNNNPFTLMPVGTGDITPVIEELITYFDSQGNKLIIKSLTNDMISEIESRLPGKFIFKPERSLYDYVYLSEDLIYLEGKKFHAKRNHINKFLSTYDYTYHPLTAELVDECIAAEEEWCQKRNCDESEGLEQEKAAIIDALNHFERLKFKGGIIKVNNKVVAFTFGEQFAKDMAVIHVEKADPDIQGSYAMINQKFCEKEWSNVKYINREEDMGIEGLRKAKLSYRPVRMIEKSIAVLKE
ncbi:MAG: uncharacterized protein PWR27_1746 [Petroclostridium sp.]|jgi:hypothetical protein|uniref:DUF2156 domain-containing protein n=1 Tax=Petroclostridium xylanilyticum TaxID=1792311 RepID=UPI000B99086F|nr:phosphatidylglycerol lysyltransferase domain-containing protein [Petroclostridium xylanilyticum]MBZ4645467.1 hypothetical protein [Clostridia bacterium]MDK2811037.1 uncharacterized protein [Petroclostridium sp.]